MITERLIHRGYFDEAGEGKDLPGGAADDTAGGEDAAAKAAADAKAAEDAKAAADKGIKIPKERFDEAVGKARREADLLRKQLADAEAKIKEAEGQVDAKKIEGEIDELEDKIDQAKADGNKELAKALRAQVRERMQTLSDARADVKAAFAAAVAVEQVRYEAAVERMERDHPELNPDDDTYDQDRVDEVLELKDAFEKAGKSSTEALGKALAAVYRGGEKPAKAAEDEAAKKAAAEAAAAKRTKEALDKGMKTKENQPADNKVAGEASDKAGKSGGAKDVAKMSEAEYDKLSEDEKRRLRGDFAEAA